MFGPLLIICALLVFAAGVLWIRSNVAKDEDSLVTTIDALLPQTQCAQCGYPGCKPYAQAVADGVQIDLCPPGVGEKRYHIGVSFIAGDHLKYHPISMHSTLKHHPNSTRGSQALSVTFAERVCGCWMGLIFLVLRLPLLCF